jgi:hypothetical protein
MQISGGGGGGYFGPKEIKYLFIDEDASAPFSIGFQPPSPVEQFSISIMRR